MGNRNTHLAKNDVTSFTQIDEDFYRSSTRTQSQHETSFEGQPFEEGRSLAFNKNIQDAFIYENETYDNGDDTDDEVFEHIIDNESVNYSGDDDKSEGSFVVIKESTSNEGRSNHFISLFCGLNLKDTVKTENNNGNEKNDSPSRIDKTINATKSNEKVDYYSLCDEEDDNYNFDVIESIFGQSQSSAKNDSRITKKEHNEATWKIDSRSFSDYGENEDEDLLKSISLNSFANDENIVSLCDITTEGVAREESESFKSNVGHESIISSDKNDNEYVVHSSSNKNNTNKTSHEQCNDSDGEDYQEPCSPASIQSQVSEDNENNDVSEKNSVDALESKSSDAYPKSSSSLVNGKINTRRYQDFFKAYNMIKTRHSFPANLYTEKSKVIVWKDDNRSFDFNYQYPVLTNNTQRERYTCLTDADMRQLDLSQRNPNDAPIEVCIVNPYSQEREIIHSKNLTRILNHENQDSIIEKESMTMRESYDDESTNTCDLMINIPTPSSDNAVSLALIPHKEPSVKLQNKKRRKFVITSVVCQTVRDEGLIGNDPNRLVLLNQPDAGVDEEVQSTQSKSTKHSKLLRLQSGLKNRKSIVRPKKKKQPKVFKNYHINITAYG